ncbi:MULTISPECIES: hypothetical protein [unclassified Endozoicomonas]|uniref:hypothetical protein n=1 Tax=unclassified Endozoicomonas TaxID=2644528 RepID=UPI003BB6E9FC
MSTNLIENQNWRSLPINKKPSLLLLSLVVCFPDWNSWAGTIELDNNNFNRYLNADHPVEGRYRLISDIDLRRFRPWEPVGNKSIPFSLILDGKGHVISGLEVSTSLDNTASGLFGSLQNSVIKQILLNQPKVTSSGTNSPSGALVGELKSSRIEEVVNYAGTIQTGGLHSHSGGIAGSISDSVIRDSVNTGTIFTTGSAISGGIAGLADQASSVSNDLNTGKIASRNLYSSPAGGIVGMLKRNSFANNNVNTGEVNAGHTEDSGGIAGQAIAASVLQNLNTGKIASDYLDGTSYRGGGNVGGIVGQASSHTRVSKNLNTGSISGKYYSKVGGITGQVINAPVVQNVNVGPVTTDGKYAYSGGIAGKARGTSIHDNLNAGAVIGKDYYSPVAGISGTAQRASVYNNVNTGLIKTHYERNKSAAVATNYDAARIQNNLDTYTKYHPASEWSGYNTGVERISKADLKANLSGLSSELWNAGDATQLPMLKGVNTPYRDLARINGTRQANNQFPPVLNEFADPGDVANATSFNRTVWNGQDGYLPFPKAFFEPQTLLAGVDCTQGGFDCSKEMLTQSPTDSTLSSESPSEASNAIPLSSAQTSTGTLITASVARTSPTSESPSEEASSTIPPSTAQPTTSEMTMASVARTSPTSELPSEASSTAPPTTAQPTTGKLTTASVARTSPTSESPSEEASSTVAPSTAQQTTGELTTAYVARTSFTSESPSEEASSTVPSSTAQPTTSELTTAFVARTLPTSESPSEEASFTVPSSTVQTTTDELNTASVARTSSTSESPSEKASSTVPSSTAQPTTGELTTASAARTSSTSESPSEEASSTVPSSTAEPTTSELSTSFVVRTSPTSESSLEASSAVPSSSAQPKTRELTTASVTGTSPTSGSSLEASSAVPASSSQPSTSVARTIQLDNNNFNQYLNADHPVKGHYELISNIDLSRFTHWEPVGNKSVPFTLTLIGNGHVISGLEVSTSADNTTAGLFGSLENSTIRQILLNQPKVTSSGDASPTGALVGEMKQSRIEEVASSAGVIKTSGSGSHAGGIAGSVSDNSIIRDSLNTGTVITTGIACAGGITGLAEQASVISNNLNTGKITPRNLHDSPAGGIVGRLKISSLAYNNLNTGEVNVGHTENSGGIAGEAEAARVVQNLNTGKIASDYLDGTSQRGGGNVGGIVGEASSHSLVSNNLNTGSISGKYGSHVGGITGRVVKTPAVQNVNVGPVTTDGKFAYSGGIAGKARGENIYDNLNAGAVVGRGRSSPVAGISGTARGANVYNNVNTGLIKTYYYDNRKSAAVANIRKAGRIENNLDTFTKNRSVLTFVEWDGYNTGVVRVPRDVLKSNLSGLSSELWNSGDSSQLPMLKGINAPYNELVRINGTKQANNQFPRALNEFADPGGNSNATFFSRTIWNSQDGYLPFLKAFFGAQTLLAGIDCTPGGFDCSEKKETTPSASSSSSEKPSASLSDNCPLPEGTPLFQTYDRENQRIYVVIQPESHEPSGIILARYQGTELDKQFGSCGTVKYTTSVNQAKILDSYQSLTGQVIHETTGPHLDIVATTTSGKATLLEFPLTAAQRDQARLRVRKNLFPDNVQINDTAYHEGVMYLTGSIDNSLFVGRYLQRRLYLHEKYPEDKEEGLFLRLSPDGKRLYVAGKSDQDAPHPLFIREYDSNQLNPAASFGNNGKEIMATNDIDTFNSQYILIQKDQSYVAVFSHEGEKLSIRRFTTENGQMDSAFIIDDRIDFSSRTKGSTTTVRLIPRDDLLHAIIYNSDGQAYVVTYQNQVNVHRFDTTFTPAAAKSMRPVFVRNNAYLAVENTNIEEGRRLVRMQEISLEIENYNYQVSPIAFSSERSTEGMSGLGIGFIAAGSVTVATIAIILAIKKFKRQRFGSGTETHELLSLDKF